MWKKMQTNGIFIPYNFVLHPQILIFSVFKIASFQDTDCKSNFRVTVLFYLFTFTIYSWHRKFVTADVTAVCVSNQQGIQRREQHFDNNT